MAAFPVWLALAVLATGTAGAQAPFYSSASIVNASDYAAGPFAPNSVLSLFGTNLSFSAPQGLTSDSIVGGRLPTQIGGVGVYVDGSLAPLLYVAPGQINFLVPMTEVAGAAQVVVVRQGVTGPVVFLNLVAAAPQFFVDETGYGLAEDWTAGNSVITTSTPTHGGDIVILFVTGLGAVAPGTASGEVATFASTIVNPAGLTVTMNGVAMDASRISYAGLSPGSAGLYQINLLLPGDPGIDPEIRVAIGDQVSAVCKLAVRYRE